LVVAPAATDEHPDHRVTHRLARLIVARSRRTLLTYQVWGKQSDRRYQLRVPALRHVARVRAALSCHASQLGRAPASFGQGFVLPKAIAEMARRPMITLASA
jgi:LmbE family N-acetylglucosaminyl deacetylase